MSVTTQDFSPNSKASPDETDIRPEKSRLSLPTVLRRRDFRLLWIGEAISLLGDQFYMIALPWLVLQLTGDALAMGAVLALGGIPRALFMLVGGALTDRFSPRNVMLTSNLLRLGLVSILAVMVITGAMQLWMLFAFALLFGLADAFFFPAQSAIIPRLVAGE
jgi:MFS family permease